MFFAFEAFFEYALLEFPLRDRYSRNSIERIMHNFFSEYTTLNTFSQNHRSIIALLIISCRYASLHSEYNEQHLFNH